MALAQQLMEGILLVDARGCVEAVNPAAEALLDASAADLAGVSPGNVFERLAAQAVDPAEARSRLAPLATLPRSSTDAPSTAIITLHRLSASAEAAPAEIAVSILPVNAQALIVLRPAGAQPQPRPPHTTHEEMGEALASAFTAALGDIHTLAATLLAASKRSEPSDQYEMLREIANESAALGEAAQALGEVTRLRTAAAPHMAPVELSDLLMSIMPRWKPRAPHHSFELALPGVTPTIIADAARVEVALELLLEAAVALAPEGGPVRVSVRPRGEEVEVSVRTFGARLPTAELQRIFEPFHRIGDLPGAQVRGGMGLPLARAILHAHRGRLHAESPATGDGLLLVASWPLLPATTATPEQRQAGEGDATPPSGDGATASRRDDVATLIPPRAKPIILIHDSDPRMVRYLRANVEAQQYRPIIAGDLVEARQLIELEEPDLILLDLAGAGEDAGAALRPICDATAAPVIVLARRHDPVECMRLLDLGAADYVVKPFSMEELLARVRVALRARQQHSARAIAQEPIFQSGDLTVDFAQRSVLMAGEPVSLSKTEFKLLRVLAQHAGMVLSHEVLLERVWGAAYSQEIEFVWVYIRRLRRKIEPDPATPRYILTVPGVGYRLARQ